MRKIVFISGSTKGIGKEIALFFAKKNYIVLVNGCTNKKNLDDTVFELKKYNEKNNGYLCDLSNYDDCRNLFEKIYNEYGFIDILINNLGVTHFDLFTSTSMESIQTLINNNIYGYINPSHIVSKKMIAEKKGSIINISSVFGEVGASCEVSYSLSKGAINTFTKSLAKELAPSNIFVNAITLGFCDTEMNNYLEEDDKKALCDEIPIGKPCPPLEVAKLCYFLGEENKYITGQLLRQDGGWI